MKWNLCICCIIKNEDYLEEFIIFHYLQGVQHFFIYDNDSNFPLRKNIWILVLIRILVKTYFLTIVV